LDALAGDHLAAMHIQNSQRSESCRTWQISQGLQR